MRPICVEEMPLVEIRSRSTLSFGWRGPCGWRIRASQLAIVAALAAGFLSAHAIEDKAAAAPVPDIRQLMIEVMDHQKQLEKVRENYTYSTSMKTETIDGNGKVTKTETEDSEVFFVNTHRIERTVKRDGKPLNDHDQQKEQEHVTKLVEKAEKTPPGEQLEGHNETVSVTKLLEIMQVSNPRREVFRGRSTIIFDFAGRHDAKTHGMAEDASKKIAGTLWVDEKDRQVARMEAHFTDNFHLVGGLLANVEKGSSFYFDQAPVNGEIWFPTGAEGHIAARVLLLKGLREHILERDYDYKKFSVETEAGKATLPGEKKQ
jgi:hypothetical protein